MRCWPCALIVAVAFLPIGCTLAQDQAQTETPAATQAAVEFAPLTLDGLTPRSERPLFARFTVSSDASRVLSVMLDESGGTGTGYDIAYIDLDFDGRLTPEDRIEPAHSFARDEFVMVSFGPLELDGYLAGEGLTQELQAQVMYQLMPTWDDRGEVTGSTESIAGMLSLTVVEDGRDHQYMIFGESALAITPEEAEVVRLDGPVTLTCETRPQEDGTLGVGIVCMIGEAGLYAEGSAELRITTAAGEVIAEEAGMLQDFGFG